MEHPRTHRFTMSYWPDVCHRFGISEEEERAFVRDAALSRSDTTYYAAAYEEKRVQRDLLFDKSRALVEELARFDTALPARLAARVGRGMKVAGAAYRLARERLVVAERVAACVSEYVDATILASSERQLWRDTAEASDRISAYYTHAMECWLDSRGHTAWEEDPDGPATDTLPHYTAPSAISRRAARTLARALPVPLAPLAMYAGDSDPEKERARHRSISYYELALQCWAESRRAACADALPRQCTEFPA